MQLGQLAHRAAGGRHDAQVAVRREAAPESDVLAVGRKMRFQILRVRSAS
jgi:hypothetical protein